MKKRTSIIVLIICAALTVLFGFTALKGWGPTGTGSMRNIRTGLDLSGGVSITYQTVDPAPSQEDMDDTIYKLQQRVEQYSTEASVYQQGLNRINIEIPGVSDANEILEELGKPGSLVFQDSSGNVVLEGTDIADAQGVARTDQTTGQHSYLVELTMTEAGAVKFAEATTANVGRPIYIIYDGETISAPTVREAITGGNAQIDGMADIDEAKTLASFIRIGSLSLELEEIYSNVVGAQIGQSALSSSLLAGLIGIILIIVFMIVVFRVSGIAAGWALLIFVFLDLIFMNAFDVTLTLPGIAGVILTIGMAVDANVIIYARMREEIALGRGVGSSVREGFRKALSAILDGNITTLIAAIVLYALGTGTIRGFAITLTIGIILSMFSALIMSRLISYALYGVGIKSERAYGRTKRRKPINFVGKKLVFFIIAIILIAAAPIGMAAGKANTNSTLNFGLDFMGGTATTVDLGEDYSLGELEDEVLPVVSEVTGDNAIAFQKITGTTQVIIKTRELTVDEREALDTALASNFDKVDEGQITAENISATISGEMRSSAIKAVVIAVICMLIYIWIRFRDVRFATSAIIALVHDIMVVLAFYAIFRLTVNSAFIAVMLTILGYSINATIVIFDRIRENLKSMQGESLRTIVNASITQTLARSIYSTLTTFLAILVLFIMGVPSVKEFTLPIIIGLIAGTYSSIFVTGSLWYLFKSKIGKNRIADTPSKTPKLAVEGPVETAAADMVNEAKDNVSGVQEKAVQKAEAVKTRTSVDKTAYQSTKRKKKRKH